MIQTKKIKVLYSVPYTLERRYSIEVDIPVDATDEQVAAISAAVHKLKSANGVLEPHNGFIDNGNDVLSTRRLKGQPGTFTLNGNEYDEDGVLTKAAEADGAAG